MLTEVGGGKTMEHAVPQLLSVIIEALPDHTCYFRPHLFDFYGLAMFVKNGVKVLEEGEIFVHKERGFVLPGDWGTHARNIQYVTLETESGLRTVINFHGLWNGRGKTDTEERLVQSTNLVNFLGRLANPHILCGDFNLLPETESLKIFEKAGLRNLIQENGITSTRSHHYTKEHRFADYAFVSEGVEVQNFKVLDEPVSDHLPLYLEWGYY